MAQLQITYTDRGGKPISVAAVNDPGLVRVAASTALREVKARLDATTDPVTAKLHFAELARLVTVFGAMEL